MLKPFLKVMLSSGEGLSRYASLLYQEGGEQYIVIIHMEKRK